MCEGRKEGRKWKGGKGDGKRATIRREKCGEKRNKGGRSGKGRKE